MNRSSAATMLFSAAVLVGVQVGFAARAEASPDLSPYVLDYAYNNAGVVCTVLDDFPSFEGIQGIALGIMDDGLSPYESGAVIGLSVASTCPTHQPLLDAYIRVYASPGVWS